MQPGDAYFLEVFSVPFTEGSAPKIPEDRSKLPPRDMLAYIYGETTPKARPVLSNVTVRFPDEHTLGLSWQLSAPGSAMVEVVRAGEHGGFTYVPPAGATEALITGIPTGVDCDFRAVDAIGCSVVRLVFVL